MDRVEQANYLVVENYKRYRIIMSFFYKRHSYMQGSLYRPDILKMMQEEYSVDYGEQEVDQDLHFLVNHGNIYKQQEVIRPTSIDDYRNKNFRYQITESSILIEEMVQQLTNQNHAARGSLDYEAIDELLKLLEQLVETKNEEVKLWTKVREVFKLIREDTANYIGYITTPEIDSRMKTEQFLLYKDEFVTYLRDYISGIQELYFSFRNVIPKLEYVNKERIIDQLYGEKNSIPLMDEIPRQEISEQVYAEFAAIKNWFRGTGSRPSEYENLMTQTNEMINKITSLIYYYGQEINQYQSKKKDYMQIANWFYQAGSLENAQEIYAGVFGLDHTRNYYVSEGNDRTSNRQNSWDLAPSKLVLSKRDRGARRERRASNFSIDHEKQKKIIQKHEEEIRNRKSKVESYFTENRLIFSQIEKLDSYTRRTFLDWIHEAISNHDATLTSLPIRLQENISTKYNFDVDIYIDFSQRISVQCDDGLLEMPAVIMKRGSA